MSVGATASGGLWARVWPARAWFGNWGRLAAAGRRGAAAGAAGRGEGAGAHVRRAGRASGGGGGAGGAAPGLGQASGLGSGWGGCSWRGDDGERCGAVGDGGIGAPGTGMLREGFHSGGHAGLRLRDPARQARPGCSRPQEQAAAGPGRAGSAGVAGTVRSRGEVRRGRRPGPHTRGRGGGRKERRGGRSGSAAAEAQRRAAGDGAGGRGREKSLLGHRVWGLARV
ncbi:spidroin-1-like [Ananas comosus]|uniref:Spidroin-1-like n=1 Tax=Ananas comosus TaxID=4615 RepID=A0A6P5EGG1_ANACO|nr:spidroin-1-like [Ananas comosus]